MKKTLAAALIATAMLMATSCSKLVIPYDSEPLCSRGKTGGYCGPITEVYDEISRKEQEKAELEKIKAKSYKRQPYKMTDERSNAE